MEAISDAYLGGAQPLSAVCGKSLEIKTTSQAKGEHQAEARETSDGSNEHS